MSHPGIGVLAVAVLGACLPVALNGAEDAERAAAVARTRERIKAARDVRGLSDTEKNARLDELEDIANQIEREWKDKEVKTYAQLIQEVSGEIASIYVPGSRKLYVAHALVLRALEKADQMPLDAECALVTKLRFVPDPAGPAASEETTAQFRQQTLRKWLHAWQRIDKTIDPNWRMEDFPESNIPPPKGVRIYVSGMNPADIEDPKARAEYEASLEAYRQKRIRWDVQFEAHELKKSWTRTSAWLIASHYMELKEAAALQELQGLLEEYIADGDSRAEILNGVRDKKVPWRLDPRSVTQPDGP